jgi:hypothetical protein
MEASVGSLTGKRTVGMVDIVEALPWGELLAEIEIARIRVAASIGASSLHVADRAELLDQ